MARTTVTNLLPQFPGRSSLLGGSAISWESPVLSAEIVLVKAEAVGALEVCLDSAYGAMTHAIAVPKDSIQELLHLLTSAAVLEFTEYREKASELQLFTFVFYQAFVLVEVEGGIWICVEECNGRVEVMRGSGNEAQSFAMQYHANGEKRKSSVLQESQTLDGKGTVLGLLNWLTSPLAPTAVQEQGFTKGLTLFLKTLGEVDSGSLDDFLTEEAPPMSAVRSMPQAMLDAASGYVKPVAMLNAASGYVKGFQATASPDEDGGDVPATAKASEQCPTQIELTVVFSSPEYESKPRWKVTVDQGSHVSELQSQAEKALGEPLEKMFAPNGDLLDPAATIDGAGLRNGDEVTAALFIELT